VNARETPDIETSSAEYAARFAGRAGEYLLATQTRTIAASLAGLSPGTALDVGGGHGQLIDPLTSWGWRVTVHGTDTACETNLRHLHGKVNCPFVLGDLASLPVPDRSFDLVIAVRLLSHVERWQALIGEMCRVARRAVVVDHPSTVGLNALTPLLFALKKSVERNTRTYASFSHSQLRHEFAKHGFETSRVVKQFFLPMVVHRMGGGSALMRGAESACRAVGLTAVAGSPAILRCDRRTEAQSGTK
jgi:ubiquinone/menaquinone biosynthesis C-methylase UbiE